MRMKVGYTIISRCLMKKLFKSAVLLSTALSAAIGCQSNSLSPETVNEAHFVLLSDAPATKTGVRYDAGSYAPYWNKGDELGVIFNLPTVKGDLKPDAVFANTSESGSKAAFKGTVTIEDGENITFYSFYPASSAAKSYVDGVVTIGLDVPSSQTPVYDSSFGYSFDPKADILIAKPTCTAVSGNAVNEVDMYFARLSGVLRVELDAESSAACYGEVVKSFKIETSAGDIAGRIAVNPLTGEYSKTNSLTSSKTITATYDTSSCPVTIGKQDENNVFLGVAPVTIASGSTITVSIETVTTSGANGHTLVKNITTTSDIVFESSKPTVLKLTLSDENIYYSLSTTPESGSTLSWTAEEYGAENAKSIAVSLNGAASGYTVSESDDDWTVTDDGEGTITVYPNAANAGTTEADIKTFDLVITHNDNASLTSTITLTQAQSGAKESKVLIIDGSQLSSTATSGDDTKTYSGIEIVFSKGAKQQSVSGDNKFSDEAAILIGKKEAYIYNKTAIPGKITKFEIFANDSASKRVSVGVNFSAESISEYSSSAVNTYTATLSTTNKIYDCSDKLPENAKYFRYQVTNDNKSQVQFRITYEEE